ncbi:unnamed protein product [Acanthoscelides obtectus]|uniref:Secreted protein n=1 Tax=Acanthoscelides obtectus TaxID=200917 RepID=A0A9P0Q7P9_ACAOB|nr:unnamed protein product [Acanthoscelides obtectus]CAH2013815.1 unnamed protein product [Acanthoscelides obtectus]CAH2014152.1 unnamed protein product [Acanthoscelides obtectus]CAK1630322.1 hypothetical protein AOBTE_LOCUS6261 [Acanthoscelides obtectus]CAK1630326.1 hypothetical protein AOBTE_LOCUS6264 [Acanthoscelides obtectus]
MSQSSLKFTLLHSLVFRLYFITKCCTCFLTRHFSTVSGRSTRLRHESREEKRNRQKSRPENRLHGPIFGRQRISTPSKRLYPAQRCPSTSGCRFPNRSGPRQGRLQAERHFPKIQSVQGLLRQNRAQYS